MIERQHQSSKAACCLKPSARLAYSTDGHVKSCCYRLRARGLQQPVGAAVLEVPASLPAAASGPDGTDGGSGPFASWGSADAPTTCGAGVPGCDGAAAEALTGPEHGSRGKRISRHVKLDLHSQFIRRKHYSIAEW